MSPPPFALSFVGVTAMTDQCGQWPEDLMMNSMANKNWHNFGCASQNNLAAQIANPNDLFTPRGETPIDAERRCAGHQRLSKQRRGAPETDAG